MPLVLYTITKYFKEKEKKGELFFVLVDNNNKDLLLLLSYMKCLLYGYNSINNLSVSGDQSFSINSQASYRVHSLLQSLGRGYLPNLVKVLSTSVKKISLVDRSVDLSVDGLHVPYDGEKRVKDWGTPFSVMMNRPYPGLYPLTALDLSSNLLLYAGSFIRAGPKEWRNKERLGNIVAPNVMECVSLLRKSGIKVRSVVADEGIASHELMNKLVDRRIEYTFALKSNSSLRKLESQIKRWYILDDDDDHRLIGILRRVTYYEKKTNLVMIKDGRRRYIYISSSKAGPKRIWHAFCKRGNHERKHGVASTMGMKNLPSNKLYQIKGHVFTVIYLNLILKAICKELNLGDVDVETLRSMFTRPCYIRWSDDGRKMMHALIVANKALLKKIGNKHTINWEKGTIKFIYYREGNKRKTKVNL